MPSIIGLDSFGWLTDPSYLVPNRWAQSANLASIGSPGPYGAGYYLQFNANGYVQSLDFAASQKVFAEVTLNPANLNGNTIITFLNGSSAWLTLNINTGGSLTVTDYTLALIGFAPANIAVGNWYRIQINVTCGTAGSGRVVVKVNGNLLLDATATLAYFGDPHITGVRFGYQNSPGTKIALPIWGTQTDAETDWFPADMQVLCVRANADGTYAQFTPSPPPTNYLNINDVNPDGDATYNYSSTVGQKDSYTIAPTLISGTINIVAVTYIGRKDNAAARFLADLVRTHGVDYLGTPWGQGPTYQAFTSSWTTNPNTGLPWTVGEVNGIEFGYSLTA